jgi:hypothetical protein
MRQARRIDTTGRDATGLLGSQQAVTPNHLFATKMQTARSRHTDYDLAEQTVQRRDVAKRSIPTHKKKRRHERVHDAADNYN